MTQPNFKALAKQFIHALETRDINAISALLADDIVFEDVPTADVRRGKAETLEKINGFFAKASSYVSHNHRIASENGTVFIERTNNVTFDNKKFSLPAVTVLEFNQAGQLTLLKDYFDWQTLERQLA